MKLAKPLVCALSFLAFATAGYAADPPGKAKKAKAKEQSASSGASTPRDAGKDAVFRSLDIDGDGKLSLAEAAGNALVVLGFDRADRNRDGKLTFAEFDSIGKRVQKKAGIKKKQARAPDSASAGATRR